jgi:outer membrane receptor for ferrienterochelin and colicins
MMKETRMTAFRRLLPLAAGLLAALGTPTPAPAADGVLNVTVRDTVGVIPDATVRVTGPDAGDAWRAQTDLRGGASFDSLAPGTYAVRASFPGFAEAEDPAVTVSGGETSELELTLNVAQLSTSITVETPNRRAQLLLDVAEPTTLIDHAQIEDTGARSAKDVLVEQSGNGIEVNAGGGQGHLSINGIPNRGVLVLINGRRFLGKDATGNLNMEELRLLNIERIEVVKGSGSALYGSDALGGVVNFITGAPAERGAHNVLTLSGGSYSEVRVDDSFSWRGDRGGINLAGGARSTDGFDLDEQVKTTIGLPPSTYRNTSANADFEIHPKVVARFFADYQHRNVTNYIFSGPTQQGRTLFNSKRKLVRYTLSPELDLPISPRTSFNLTYNYGRYERDESRLHLVTSEVEVQDPWRETLREIRVTGRHGWMAGGREHPLQGGYEFRNEALSRGSLSLQDPERDVNVVWAQQELNLGSRLTVSAGVRYDSYTDFGSEWSPKAEAVFRVAPEHRLRGSYGHGFRPASFGELHLEIPFFVGNPDLEPETSDGFTGGYTFAGQSLQFSADYYYTKVQNGIVFDLPPDFPLSPATYKNEAEFTSQGVNLDASFSLPGGFTPSVSYTYNQRRDGEGQDIGGYPPHAAFVKLLWTNPRLGLRANLRGQIKAETLLDADPKISTPAYSVWYVQVRKRVTSVGSYTMSLYGQVDNLFDTKDVFQLDADGNPIPGEFQFWLAPRGFQAGISVDMDWTR